MPGRTTQLLMSCKHTMDQVYNNIMCTSTWYIAGIGNSQIQAFGADTDDSVNICDFCKHNRVSGDLIWMKWTFLDFINVWDFSS